MSIMSTRAMHDLHEVIDVIFSNWMSLLVILLSAV